MLIQFFLITGIVCALIVTWRRVSQGVIGVREAVAWSVLWIAAIVVILLPAMTTRIAQWFGVGRGVDFVLYASVLLLFFLVFRLMIEQEKMERKLTEMVRRDALRGLNQESNR